MGADPRLFRLEQIESFAGAGAFSVRALSSPGQIRPDRKPVLFIHGAEYGSHEEVIEQMIQPFFSVSGLTPSAVRARYDVFFLSWHSDLICKKKHNREQVQTIRKSAILDFLRGGPRFPEYFADVERRARVAARYLEPFWQEMLAHSAPYLPEIVTHSLGGYLFSDLIQNLATEDRLPANLGSWLSLQPAVTCDAYLPGGMFDRVPEVYSHAGSAKEVWISRFDIVLGVLYPMAAGKGPLKLSSLPDFWHTKDLTWSVREAHGSVSFSPYVSDFFSRIGVSLRDRYASSGFNVATAHSI